MNDHTFVICAYQESAYLEDCIRSLLAQTVSSRILLSTATPNEHIRRLAGQYGLELRVNTGDHGIAQDWEFALRQADTPYVTLAHQDDVYEPAYAETVLRGLERAEDPIIAFTDYFEIRNGERVFGDSSRLLRVKQKLLSPLKSGRRQKSVWWRRRCLSLGNAICCPAVTYVMARMPEPVFRPHFKSNVDWQTWERLSREPGAFVYLPRPLMGHRVHEASTTTQVIGEGAGRSGEDLEMFRMFWPGFAAKLLTRVYAGSQDSNRI